MRRALIVGIDDYVGDPLDGCVNDAEAIGACWKRMAMSLPTFKFF